MVDDHRAEALDDFIDQLVELRARAGDPSLPELRRLSERACAHGGRGLVLAQSTTHDILSRKRTCWPKWSWVASYLNACRAAAAETGLPVEPLGTLEEWNARFRAAKTGTTYRHSPATARGARSGGRGRRATALRDRYESAPPEPAAGPARIRRDPQDGPADGPDDQGGASRTRRRRAERAARTAGRDAAGDAAREAAQEARSLSQQRYLTAYGECGVRLLNQAEKGDPEAAYRLGVLLCTDQRPSESDAWLRQSAQRGHTPAHELLAIEQRDRWAHAAEHAHDLAEQAEHAGDIATAMVYYESAARYRHPTAAFRLGAIYRDREEFGQAGYWFSRADEAGSPYARDQFEQIHRGILTSVIDFAGAAGGPPDGPAGDRPEDPHEGPPKDPAKAAREESAREESGDEAAPGEAAGESRADHADLADLADGLRRGSRRGPPDDLPGEPPDGPA